MKYPTICLIVATLANTLTAAPCHVWIEAEKPHAKSEDMTTKHWYDPKHEALSGGVSIGSNKSSDKTWLRYQVDIPADGQYQFYVRKFWKHGPFRFRWDDGPWQVLENRQLLDTTKLKGHCINWQPAGTVDLKKGTHRLEIQAVAKFGPFVLDCMLLTCDSFIPQGKTKPGEKTGLAEKGKWAFEPDTDSFKPDPLNLAAMNEPVAGQSGWIKMDAIGNFTFPDGRAIRFWAVNTNIHHSDNINLLKTHAKFLAKRGVNMWRHHGRLNPGPDVDPLKNINEQDLLALQRGVAIFKQHGIYCTMSPYWATHFIKVGDAWQIDGVTGRPVGTLFWEPKLQKAYKYWLKEALTRPNPFDPDHTPLKDDPALAIIQIQNEDSLLFWTAQNIKGRELERLTARYHAWRKANNLPGTPALKIQLWKADDTADQDIKHTMRFLTELMYQWNQELARYLKEDIGYQGLVNAGNWKTADQQYLLDLERYSYSANQVIGCNRYINGGQGRGAHVNVKQPHKAGYQINVGDYFQDTSTLTDPARLATNARQVDAKAYIIPESTWVAPMSYQSEAPFLVAAYSALNGIDAFYWFTAQSVGYDATIAKWQFANPSILGGFPAAALMFRRGDLLPGQPAVIEQRNLNSLWQLQPAKLPESAGFDLNRDAEQFNTNSDRQTIDPLAYLVGPVIVRYGNSDRTTVKVEQYINRKARTVTSNTGQIRMDYGRGICTVNAPKAQGATGFLGKQNPIQLSDLSIQSNDHYATILAVSLDDLPIAQSRKLLLQITTRCRPYQWQTEDRQNYTVKNQTFTGKRITQLGTTPWNIDKTRNLSIALTNPHLAKAGILDANLYPVTRPVIAARQGTTLNVNIPDDVMYILLSE